MKKTKRGTLSKIERAVVHWKTDGHCHVCGGKLGKNWTADHVIPREHGGISLLENYLPACKVCNRLRWSYHPDNIQFILQLGIYARREWLSKSKSGEQSKLGQQIQELYQRRDKQAKRRIKK